MVTGGDDGSIRIWDVLSGALVRDLPRRHDGSVLGLATGTLSDGRAVIVSTGDDRVARVWDLQTGDRVAEFTRHTGPVRAVAVAQLDHGPRVVTGDSAGRIWVWDPETGRAKGDPHELGAADSSTGASEITAIALVELEGVMHVVAAQVNGAIHQRRLASRHPTWKYSPHGARAVRALAVAEHDGRPVVVSAGDDGALRVWDPAAGPGGQDAQLDFRAEHRSVWALAVAELDGRPAIVSAGDTSARVWDLADGTPIGAPFIGHSGTIRALATVGASDRIVVISAGDDRTPMLWDLTPAGAANEPFTGHEHQIRSLLFKTIDGRNRLLSGSSDATVRRWDPDTGAQTGPVLRGHRGWVGSLDLVHVGGRACIVSGGADHIVRIRDAATGEHVGDPIDHRSAVTALLVTQVGGESKIVSACLDGSVRVWDPEKPAEAGQPRYRGHGSSAVWALVPVSIDPMEPDPLIVSAGADADLHVWRPASGERVRALASGHSEVTALAAVPSRPTCIATAGRDGRVRVHDLSTGEVEDWRPAASPVRALVLVPSGDTTVIATAHQDGRIRFSDTTDLHKISAQRGHGGEARALASGTTNGRPAIFSAGDDHLIRVWDVARKAVRRLHRDRVWSVAITPLWEGGADTGPLEVLSGSDDDTIQIRDLDWNATERERVLPAHHRGVRALAVSAGAIPPVIVSGGVDRRLQVWDFSGNIVGRLPGHGDWVRALATGTFPGVGPVAVSASGDGYVGVWDLRTMRLRGEFRRVHNGGVRAVDLAELVKGDASTPVIVSGSTDRTVQVTSLVTGETVGQPFTRHLSGVRALAMTKLGGTAAVISGDDAGAVLAWELGSLEDAGQVAHGPGEVNAIAQRSGYEGYGCSWVAVAAGETVTLSSWTADTGWRERAAARCGCEVLSLAMSPDVEDDEVPSRLVIGSTLGVAVLEFAADL